jgi:hypothetical protein
MLTKTLVNNLQVVFTKTQTGHTTGDSITWTAVCEKPISKQMALKLQEDQGWGQCGYGFVNYSCQMVGDLHIATWICQANCE